MAAIEVCPEKKDSLFFRDSLLLKATSSLYTNGLGRKTAIFVMLVSALVTSMVSNAITEITAPLFFVFLFNIEKGAAKEL